MLLILFYAVVVAIVFSLTYKLQPAFIFIDEVDSLLGQCRTTDHEVLTNMKTEFIALWDGFTPDREFLLLKQVLHLCSLFMQ